MKIREYVDRKLVIFSAKKEKFDVLTDIANVLEKNGKVTSGYKQSLIEREKKFPTGLETETIGIAIPHTDSHYVKESAIAVCVLEHPVPFIQMGTEDEEVKVELIFMLALKNAEDQLEMLQTLVELIQDDQIILALKNAGSADDVLASIERFSKEA
ncbi:PTS sugar transporter subunit IIA [Vagococcus acidifermentans]|uniref:PTS fructose transporter subunit IIA n=1 Tax=Vagococcus acidifermentans TaxID=564710 RepID=A0A430AQN5_9ENTE|nr:PTS sugar transporter subunit IIA [Vagococcus acidifermentans]RSU10441.1 PTS fructose transporter subunit IIA [Vagococcus acidifermentans]